MSGVNVVYFTGFAYIYVYVYLRSFSCSFRINRFYSGGEFTFPLLTFSVSMLGRVKKFKVVFLIFEFRFCSIENKGK